MIKWKSPCLCAEACRAEAFKRRRVARLGEKRPVYGGRDGAHSARTDGSRKNTIMSVLCAGVAPSCRSIVATWPRW